MLQSFCFLNSLFIKVTNCSAKLQTVQQSYKLAKLQTVQQNYKLLATECVMVSWLQDWDSFLGVGLGGLPHSSNATAVAGTLLCYTCTSRRGWGVGRGAHLIWVRLQQLQG